MPKITHLKDEAEKLMEKGLSKKEAIFQLFASSLDSLFQEYSDGRLDKEEEWTRAMLQYEGEWDQDDRTKIERAMQYARDESLPTVNITRPKTNIAIARLWDVQFPVGGDYNFSMAPTPIPKLIEKALHAEDPDEAMAVQAAVAGVPAEQVPTPAEVAKEIQREATEACAEMRLQLTDNLVQAHYGKKARRAIEDLAILGTAVIKGPVLTPKVKRRYRVEETSDGEKLYVLKSEVEHVPEVFRVDPRLLYPDPTARELDDMEDCFELHLMSASKLMDLAESPAFMSSQVAGALKGGPTSASDLPSSILQSSFLETGIDLSSMYIVKEYHGPLSKETLYAADMIDEEEYENPLTRYFGEAWVCNGRLLRLSFHHLEGDYRLPYHISVWERDPSSLFGHGMPYLLRHPQRIVNNAYLMLLDNAALTAGPQIVLNKEMIEPANTQSYDIEPMKVWFMTEYGANVNEAMQFVNVPAQMEGISNIIDLAMQFGDIESAVPQIQQGEIPTGNNTFSGIATVLSATNISQKRASLSWDDNITRPLMEMWYHHEMQYGENEKAKGDMQVVIGGATERIDAQIKAQELERALGLAQTSEEFQIHIDPAKAFRQLIKLNRVGDILRPLDEVEAIIAQQQQAAEQAPNPEAMSAEAALLTAQARMREQEIRAEEVRFDHANKQEQLRMSMQKELAEVNARREEAFVELTKSQDQRELKLLELAIEKDLTVEELAKKVQIAVMNNETARNKILADIEKFREEINAKYTFGEGI